jgi:hypothetical protein
MAMEDPYYYDCGVEFNITGGYGREEYDRDDILSLNALYHLLFVNFAALTVCLFAQPDGQQLIAGKVLSPELPVRNYCAAMLRTLWYHMHRTMRMSVEEASLLVKMNMENFLKVISPYYNLRLCGCHSKSPPVMVW